MGLSCSCEDFDKGDFESWWEPGRETKAPAGVKCCECCAPIPEGDEVATILHFESYHLDDPPRNPGEDDDDYQERVWEWRDNHPDWEDDYERFERVDSVDYRCDRCDGLAASIEDLGYCLTAPGDLIDSHIEYAWEHAKRRRKWVRDAEGVFQPRDWTVLDHARAAVRNAWRETKYTIRWRIFWRVKYEIVTWWKKTKRIFA